jgi:hypothetical protein
VGQMRRSPLSGRLNDGNSNLSFQANDLPPSRVIKREAGKRKYFTRFFIPSFRRPLDRFAALHPLFLFEFSLQLVDLQC